MKILKGLFKVIFDSLMLAAIVALIFSINGKKVFNDLLYNNVFKPVVSEEINTIVGKEVESNELDELLNNEETKKLIDDYINSTIGDLSSDGDDVDTDVGDRFLQYVKDNREFFEEKFGVTITDENIDKIKKTDDYKNVVKEYKETIKVTKSNLSERDKNIIKIYTFIISDNFKYILIGIIIFSMLMILLLEKSIFKLLKHYSIDVLLSGLMVLGMSLVVQKIVDAANTNKEIIFSVKPLMDTSIVVTVIGFVLLIIYLILNKIYRKEKSQS